MTTCQTNCLSPPHRRHTGKPAHKSTLLASVPPFANPPGWLKNKIKVHNKGANDKWANRSSKPTRRPPALALGVGRYKYEQNHSLVKNK